MSCDAFRLHIDDYVDDARRPGAAQALDVSARQALETHLSECAACRQIVDETQAIRDAAVLLERHVPSPQTWNRIAAAVDADRRRPWWQIGGMRLPQLAAAAVAVAIIVGVAVMAWRDLAPLGTESAPRIVAENTTPSDVVPSVNDEYRLAEEQYVEAIAGLEQQADTAQLTPDVADVVQANLTVVNQAIDESRAALEAEPESQVAQESLFDAFRSKVELLQNALVLINEMRQGDQEAAAAIVSGQNQ
jgi:hypothetical protein